MTLDKAIEYLDYILKEHPRIESADFGSAIKLGREALKEIHRERIGEILFIGEQLPGESKD